MGTYLSIIALLACCILCAAFFAQRRRIKESEAKCQLAFETAMQAIARITLMEKTVPTLQKSGEEVPG